MAFGETREALDATLTFVSVFFRIHLDYSTNYFSEGLDPSALHARSLSHPRPSEQTRARSPRYEEPSSVAVTGPSTATTWAQPPHHTFIP